MIRSHLSRFWIAVAVVPLLAGTALASGPALFVCRGDSIARVSCCCPPAEHRATASSTTPTVSAACCCDLSQLTATPALAVLEPRSSAVVEHQSMLATLTPAFGAASAAFAPDLSAWLTARLAKPGPLLVPILLCKQSLLI